jgi:hypothetical protein
MRGKYRGPGLGRVLDALLAMNNLLAMSKRGRRRGGATHQGPEATTGSLRASSPAQSRFAPFTS